MDLTETIVPKSDQMNADDLMTGDRTFTIAEVRKGSSEQPVAVRLAEFPDGRPYYPCKSMRRVMVAAWGSEASAYVGRRLTLYRDPAVKFGGESVGGIRIRALSHIEKPLTLALTVTRGKRAPYRVQPLSDDAPTVPSVSAATLAEMRDLFTRKGIAEEAQLPGVNRIIGGSATSVEVITEQEAQRVIAALRQRADASPSPAPVDQGTGEVGDGYDPNDPTTHPDWQGGQSADGGDH